MFRPARGILVVNDSNADLNRYGSSLHARGYRPLLAPSGAIALKLLERDRDSIVLLVTEVKLPDLSGPDLARLARALDSRIRAIYLGEAPLLDPRIHAEIAEDRCRFLAKPVEAGRLVAAVEAWLPASAAAPARAPLPISPGPAARGRA